MIGQVISHYKILSKLGEGGMGIVYKARDTRLDRDVALKFLPSELTSDSDARERFIHEAKAASSLSHANICAIHDIDESDSGQMFIIMDYYSGQTLRDLLKNGPLSIEKALQIARQTAEGLARAHEAQIIHRDIKPANIVVTERGEVRILDFGLAKLSAMSRLTRTGSTLGTAAYMSPEQARGDEVDTRADVWSLGVVLYEMLAGVVPFRGEHEAAMLYSICNEEPASLEDRRKDIPVLIGMIVARTLQKDPAKRYQSMSDFIRDIDSYLQTISKGSSSVTTLARIRYGLRRRRTTSLIATVSLAAVVLIVILRSVLISPQQDITDQSIAILPFTAAGVDSETYAYYPDGFSYDIRSDFSRLPNVIVVSCSKSSYGRHGSLSDSAMAAQLGVRYLVRGRMQFPENRVSMTISLYDQRSSTKILEKSYEGRRTDIFTLGEKLLQDLADAMDLRGRSPGFVRYRTSPDAYELYLQGIYHRNKVTKDDNRLALSYLNMCLTKDSQFVPGLEALTNAQIEHLRQGWTTSDTLLGQIEQNSRRIMRLDSNSSAGYDSYGGYLIIKGEIGEGVKLYLKALEKQQYDPVALTSLAFLYLFNLNDPGRGLIYLKRLLEYSPLDWLAWLNTGVAYGQLKNYPEALRAFRRSLALNPEHYYPVYCLGYTFERFSQYDSAEMYYARALGMEDKDPRNYKSLLMILLAEQHYAAADSLMELGIRNVPDDNSMYYGMGLVKSFRRQEPEAKRYFSLSLQMVQEQIRHNPKSANLYVEEGLSYARLGQRDRALQSLNTAALLDTTDTDLMLNISRIYAILGEKGPMIEWFSKARKRNPEYDGAYLKTSWDFEKYRDDPNLIVAAESDN